MSQFTIDLDAEAVFLDGAWYTREELARRIKAMLDGGDFKVATPSLALQELTQTIHGVRTLAFRCTPDMADALGQLATRMGQSVGALLREASAQLIAEASTPVRPAAVMLEVPAPQSELPREPRASAPRDDAPRLTPEAPKSAGEPPKAGAEVSKVVAGPGALRAAGVLAIDPPAEARAASASPVGEGFAGEYRWFKP